VLFGSIYSAGGYLIATAASAQAPGTVTLGQGISLSNLFSDSLFGATTWLESQGGAMLKVTGKITGNLGASVRVPSGKVALANPGNSYDHTDLYGGTLEIAATGAAGSGAMRFIGGANPATLVIDKKVAFDNVISGFGPADSIDLRGFAFTGSMTDTFNAGTLTVSNGAASASLHLAGAYNASQFTFASDGRGGTLLGMHL
jgi:hypothetical protein